MAIPPEDFDVPVVDYRFSDISSPRSMLDQMASAGGFTATKLATARDILLGMKKQVDDVDGDVLFTEASCRGGNRGCVSRRRRGASGRGS